MPLPTLFDLRKVPVGSWAEYAVTAPPMPAMKQRFALVAREGKNVTLELSMEGGLMTAGARIALQIVTTPDLLGSDDRVVIQVSGAEPMELPQGGAGKPLRQIAANELGPGEAMKVAAGSFTTRKTQQKNEWGAFTAWLSQDVPPLGLVKLTGKPSAAAGSATGEVNVELTAKGGGAKPTMKGKPRPFDPTVLMAAMQSLQASQPTPAGASAPTPGAGSGKPPAPPSPGKPASKARGKATTKVSPTTAPPMVDKP